MSESQLQALTILTESSEEMLQMALTEQWTAVIEKQVERDVLIKAFFSQELTLESEFIALNIKNILDIDSQIADLVGGYKNELKSQLKKMVHGKSAVKAYSKL